MATSLASSDLLHVSHYLSSLSLQTPERKLQDPNIVELAVNTPELSTLVSLLQLANLTDVLSTPGPFTVFAPSDSAFAKLPEATVTAVTGDPELLDKVLKYHVVSGAAVLSTALSLGQTATTVEGSDVEVTSLSPVTINDAVVTTADVTASNGVVHIIDTVLIPPDDSQSTPAPAPSTGTIAELAATTPELSTLAFLLTQAGLVEALSGPGPFTVFAPVNNAFATLPARNWIIQTPVLLNSILLYHVVPGELLSSSLTNGAVATTLEGRDVTVTSLDPVMIQRSTVITADIVATNGVIHLIDNVMIPPGQS